ncbi:maleylpyruvate isomerase N-terminal domain-containing protein [Brevibacterium sp. 2SA]|uniref:maleylpyruvate isomerase N-terminal domain-containing protein n=1 Tax=Brevibacterium sp. 2SA TaxID=2502198 RepID=UPI0010FA51BD|nr:maleylpyruvate isomerase N-terminal domain-containing protein [Brevibacterium sp. 2SA]
MLSPVIAENLDRAEDCWVQALRRLGPPEGSARYAAPSGCQGWSNRELVNHLIGGGLRYAMLLDQDPPAEVEATRDRDHLGEDPLEAFWTHERRFRRLAADVDLTVPVSHRIGELPGTQLVRMRILELALHAADLSVGTGDRWPVDDALAEFMATDLAALIVELGDTGGYAPPRTDAPAASAADRVLLLSGRAVTRRA